MAPYNYIRGVSPSYPHHPPNDARTKTAISSQKNKENPYPSHRKTKIRGNSSIFCICDGEVEYKLNIAQQQLVHNDCYSTAQRSTVFYSPFTPDVCLCDAFFDVCRHFKQVASIKWLLYPFLRC